MVDFLKCLMLLMNTRSRSESCSWSNISQRVEILLDWRSCSSKDLPAASGPCSTEAMNNDQSEERDDLEPKPISGKGRKPLSCHNMLCCSLVRKRVKSKGYLGPLCLRDINPG